MSSTVGAAKTAAAKAAKERKEAARTIQVQGEIVSTGSILNLETFLETRRFEIHALLSAMKSSKYAGKKLKFQTLPRRLRRRTASYNPKRIPKNVRHIALKETAMAVLQKEKLRKRRQRLLKTRRAHKVAKLKYEKRQTKVRWLETHIWHTKRCKMGYLWGHSLALHMNEKSYRPTHRAVSHISLLHDASYKGCIRLSGPEKSILELLTLTTNPFRFPGAKRYLSGKWQCTTDIHYPGSFPKLLISPALFLWRCFPNVEDTGSNLEELDPEMKELWIFVHPAAFDEVYRMFEQLILKKLSIVKLTDLRRELCTFELNGPRSNAFLSRVLIPCARGNYAENIQKWNEWMQHTSSASLQPGVALELSVQDPRISFPVKLSDQVNIPATNVAIRDVNIPSIWDHSQRERLLLNRITESQIQQRRKKLLVPGSKLPFTDQDSMVPVLLIHRGCGYSCSEFDSGWSIILPKGWANDFWKSFIFSGIRIAGLREMHQISYEAGKACYPYEYVETPGFNDWNIEQRKNEALLYNRKPAKCRLATFEQHFGLELLEVLKLIFVDKAVRLKDLWTVDGTLLSRMASMEGLTNTTTLEMLKQAYNSFLKVDDWNSSIIRVQVVFLERGRPEKGAIIYRLNDQAFKSWKICEARMKNPLLIDDCVVGGSSALQLQPIGYVMTGNFHLDEGRGVGMGFCSFMACKEAAEWQTNGKIMVAVRNVRSSAHHFAVIQPVLL